MEDLNRLSDEELLSSIKAMQTKDVSSLSDSELMGSINLMKQDMKKAYPNNEGIDTLGERFIPAVFTGVEPKQGEQTIYGDIFNRPSAAIRSGIRAIAKGENPIPAYIKGANDPENVETFLSQSQRSPVPVNTPMSENPAIANLEFLGKGAIRDVAAFGADVITSPADVLLFAVGALANRVSQGESSVRQIGGLVDKKYQKAIRPSKTGRYTAPQIAKKKENARLAIDSIAKNKENLKLVDESGQEVTRLPQNLDELSQAIYQTKRKIFEDYTNLKNQAGEELSLIFVDELADDVLKQVDNLATKRFSPETVKEAENLSNILSEDKFYTIDQANDIIQILNKQLEAYYRNPNPSLLNQMAVKQQFANTLRKKLDSVIERDAGKGFQALKNRYGALKDIEKEVNGRLVVNMRRNPQGLLDFTNVFTLSDVISGVATGNPLQVTKGAAGAGIKGVIKRMNDPDYMVKKLFDDVDLYYQGGDSVQKVLRSSKKLIPASVREKQKTPIKRKTAEVLQ